MKAKKNYRIEPFSSNRQMVAASSAAASRFHTIHSLLEVDVTKPRRIIREHKNTSGESLSFTAYLVKCLAETISEFPQYNAFQRGRQLIVMENLTISVLVERELEGGRVPEPIGIQKTQTKTFLEIQKEIREAQFNQGEKLGSLSKTTWVRFIPGWLLGLFIRIASRNITLAERYGKTAVTAVGMYSSGRSWLVPLSSATILMSVGGIHVEPVLNGDRLSEAEYLHLTLSFDHNIIDGAPAARFCKHLESVISSGDLLNNLPGNSV